MNEKTRQRYEVGARIAKAMAHPSRLLMLDLLQQREMCVSELTGEVGADQSTVSKHLAVLRRVGLVDLRREGTLSIYRVSNDCLDAFFSCMETVEPSDPETRRRAPK